MNKLIEFFSRQHTFVNILTFFVIGAGIYSVLTIKRETFPNISFEVVNVTTMYPNASAESVEALITNPLESDLKELDGIKEYSSISSEGRSVISITLDPDQITLTEAQSDIQNIIDRFRGLPDGAEDPLVVSANSKTSILVELALGGSLEIENLRTYAKALKRKLEGVEGVAKISYKGLPEYELRVEAKPEMMAKYDVGLTELINALKTAHVDLPGGSMVLNEKASEEFVVKTQSYVADEKSIKNIVLRSNVSEEFIRVGDVAKVSLQLAEEEVLYRTDGLRGINLVVSKKSSADAIHLVSAIKSEAKKFINKIAPDLRVHYINDTSEVVERRVAVLSNNLVVGLALVLVILSIMLPFRVALVAAVGIPFSFFATLMIFDHGDISLNLISMLGLILVLGMLVDDAIVVTENAQRKMDEGMSPEMAAIKGTQEIWAPVTTSVSTTLAAFLPLMFMSGIFGQFLQNLPIGVLLALLLSLFECFFILPSHIASWVKARKPGDDGKVFMRWWRSKVDPLYARLIKRCLQLKYLVISITFGLTALSVFVAINFLPFELFPGTEDYNFTIKLETEVGKPLEYTENIVNKMEKKLQKITGKNLESIVTTVGMHAQSGPASSSESRGSHYAEIKAYMRADTSNFDKIFQDVETYSFAVEEIKDLEISRGRSGPPVGKAVSIRVVGGDVEKLMPVVEEIKSLLKEIEGITGVVDSHEEGKSELIVKLDEEKLSLAGVARGDVANSVRATLDGIVVDKVQKLDEELDVRVTLPASEKMGLGLIEEIRVPNRKGDLLPLRRVAKIERKTTSGALSHLDGFRVIRVEAEVTGSMTSAKANKIMRGKVETLEAKYPEMEFIFGGEESDRLESFKDLGKTFLIAMVGIFLLLMLQFNNLYQPFIIACIVPLGLLSVVWAFLAHGHPLSFLAGMGMIALAGVIINNAIVFIDFVNRERKSGKEINEAILSAAQARLRPIFLTTVTTVAGILPTAYGIGGRDDFVVPVALALGWGMLFGSILTLIVLPALIGAVEDIIGVFRRMFKSSV